MVVMGIYFVYRTQPWWRKTKEQQPWNNTKQIFPEQKAKKVFALRHLCPLHEVLSGIGNTYINIWTNCQFIWSGIVYIWLSDFQKLFLWQPCLNKLMHVENWETDQLQLDLYVDISYKFHSCMSICFSCMYTNKCKHFHKWFGNLYRDNSVLMRVLQIQ